jgi:hypothetical protein
MCECGTLKPIEIILRRGIGFEGKELRDESNLHAIYVYMEISQ